MIELLKKHQNANGLKNDFSDIYFLTNNLQRAKQAEACLAREMRSAGIEAMIPPSIMPYRLGFLIIADNILNNRYGASRLTEYDNEWIRFFIYKLSLKAIKPEKGGPEYMTANRRHNLVPDFDAFIADAVNHVKWKEAAALKPPADSPSAAFVEVYNEYMKHSREYKGNKFFSALAAYMKLHEYLSEGNKPAGFNKTLIIEDFDDMEPVFKETARMLEKAGVTVVKTTALENPKPDKSKTEKYFYGFMTPLDEAEVVGYKIRELIAKGATPDDITVVPYNSTAESLVELVFHRFGIRSVRMGVLGNNALFDLFRDAVYLDSCPQEHADKVLALLSSASSPLSLSAGGLKRFNNCLKKTGFLFGKNPAAAVKTALENNLKELEEDLKEDKDADEKRAKDLICLRAALDKLGKSTGEAGMMQILEGAVIKTGKTDDAALMMIAESARFMDAALEGVSGDDRKFMIEALLSAAAQREFIQETDPKTEAKQYINEIGAVESEGLFVPVMDARSADNTASKHIFLFGLTAAADRKAAPKYPGYLSSKLGIEQNAERKESEYAKTTNVIKNAQYVHMSYSYLSMEGSVEGMSNIARMTADHKTRALYPELSDFKIIQNSDNSLIRSSDIIEPAGDAPEPAYMYALKKGSKTFGSKDGREKLLESTTIGSLLSVDEKTGKKRVSVTDFVKYIQCPRKFAYSIIAKKTGLMPSDMESQARMDKGTFWHRVFQAAAVDFEKDFNSGKVGQALVKAFDSVIPKVVAEAFGEESEQDFTDEAKGLIIPMFADFEAARRKRFKGLKTIGSEYGIKTELKNNIMLEGKIDRIDIHDGGAIFWDYKTGARPPGEVIPVKGKEGQKVFSEDYTGAYGVQLAAYLHMVQREKESFISGALAGGVIGLKGSDSVEDLAELESNYRDAFLLMEKAFEKFSGEFLDTNIMKLEEASGCESGFCRKVNCSYCDFSEVCAMLELKGVKEDDKENN